MLYKLSSTLDRFRNAGLLVLRVGVGISFMVHGGPKVFGGPERWQSLAQFAGITFLPTFFGFLGGLAEFAGGLLLALGLLFRPACFFLFCTMGIALAAHLRAGDDYSTLSHALEMGVVFLSLFIIGPGRYALDEYVFKRRRMGF